jgi:hypothetical protein
MYDVLFVQNKDHHYYTSDNSCNNRCQCGALRTHPEHVNKKRIEANVRQIYNDRYVERYLGISADSEASTYSLHNSKQREGQTHNTKIIARVIHYALRCLTVKKGEQRISEEYRRRQLLQSAKNAPSQRNTGLF